MLLCTLDDVDHHLERFQRILALRGLTGEHHRVCTVVYRVGNVCHLRSCGAGISHHGIQHLRGRDNSLEVAVRLLNEHLLKVRNLLSRDLHAKVTAGYHDTVRRADDLIDILDSLRVLDLRDDRNIRSVQFF